MEYQVSDKIQKKLDALTADASVQKALAFMERIRSRSSKSRLN